MRGISYTTKDVVSPARLRVTRSGIALFKQLALIVVLLPWRLRVRITTREKTAPRGSLHPGRDQC
jgi:hypothetical protein